MGYVIGKAAPDREILLSAERFHFHKGTWEKLPQMSVSQYGGRAAVLCGYLYVVGGLGIRGSTLQRFDFNRSKWDNDLSPMPSVRSNHGQAVIAGQLYVCGGEGEIVGVGTSSSWRFEPRALGG